MAWRENWSEIIFFKFWNKSKLFQICWNAEKIGQKLVSDFLNNPPSNLGRRKCWRKIQTCSKLAERAKKLVRNNFDIPSPNWGLKKLVKWKNQSCSKLDKMTRKNVDIVIKVVPNWLYPPPPPNWGRKKCGFLDTHANSGQRKCLTKNSNLFQIGWNG